MESRIAVVSILVEDIESAGLVNDLLHLYGQYVVARMGVPYREKGISIICVVMDAPGDITSALSGKLGMLSGVSSKTIATKAKTV
ncbi:MAG: TM1266 family iron-only hydrogenase system putative regulator [Christensenellales bacterium]|jgi:putative iron-only hydrogenase system regulator